MSYTHSLVLIVPAEHREAVEAAGVALGHTGTEYNIPLSANGEEPATHYGLRAWVTTEAAYTWIQAPSVPPLSPEQVAWLRSTLIMDARPDDGNPLGHFLSVAAGAGLARILGQQEI